jgi:hypothetical protein
MRGALNFRNLMILSGLKNSDEVVVADPRRFTKIIVNVRFYP